MRTRVVRAFNETKGRTLYVVQQWVNARLGDENADHWSSYCEFEIGQYNEAMEFAMNLSMTKKPVQEMGVFDDGVCVIENPGVDSAVSQ